VLNVLVAIARFLRRSLRWPAISCLVRPASSSMTWIFGQNFRLGFPAYSLHQSFAGAGLERLSLSESGRRQAHLAQHVFIFTRLVPVPCISDLAGRLW